MMSRLQLHPVFKATVSAMQAYAPLHLADSSWDNVGSLVEAPYNPDDPRHNQLKNVLLCIDLTPAVLDEAISLHCAAIVAYHPLIFSGVKKFSFSNPHTAQHTTVTAIRCISQGVSVFCPHTSLDAVKGGINDWLCDVVRGASAMGCEGGDALDFCKPIDVVESKDPTKEEGVEGYGRMASFQAKDGVPLSSILQRLKEGLGIPTLRVALPSSSAEDASSASSISIKNFAVCGGSGSSVFRNIAKKKCKMDLLLTGEMSHHEVLALVQQGTAVVLTEHTNTERGFLEARLRTHLQSVQTLSQLGVTVYCSRVDRDPLVVM